MENWSSSVPIFFCRTEDRFLQLMKNKTLGVSCCLKKQNKKPDKKGKMLGLNESVQ